MSLDFSFFTWDFFSKFVLNGLLRWPLLISLAILAPLSLIWAWPRDRAAEPA